LESILLAAEAEATLWTDDFVLGLVAKSDFQVRRIWTQVLLFIALREGAITQNDYDSATARMVGWHYQGIALNRETLVAAAEIANWDSTCWPLPQVMQSLGTSTADPVTLLREAAEAIRGVWRRDLPDHARREFLFALLRGIRSERMVRRLLSLIPRLFRIDFFAAQEVVLYSAYWLENDEDIRLP
jgi:hypothetical protein